MSNKIILLLLPFLFFCKVNLNSFDDKNSIFQNISLLFLRNTRLTILGTAVKGIVKNASVIVSPLNADGTCNYATVLASGTTDSNGDYSISYYRTGSAVCLTVSGDSNGNTKLFDEKENTDLTLTSSSSFKQVSVIVESKLANNATKKQLVSPFSSLLSKRLQYLTKQSGQNTSLAALHTKASKEIVIRFGLSNPLSSATRATPTFIQESDYPELDDLSLNLKDPSNTNTAKTLSVLAGISYLANKVKTGPNTTPNDINTVIEAFAKDFEDGQFDGKGSDGKQITMVTAAASSP